MAHIIDPKFRLNMLSHYIIQTAIAAAFMFVVLLILHGLGQLVIVAALGSSAFTVFAMPDKVRSRARYVVGGHVCCLVTGTLLHLLTHHWLFTYWAMSPKMELIGASSLAVGASLFLMCVTDTEHPPAAGVAVGTAIAPFRIDVAVTVVLGATMLSLGRFLLRRWLKALT